MSGGVGWLAMNQVPTNWCIVSTQKVTKMFLPPPHLWLSHPPSAQPAEKEILLCWRSRPFANHTKDKVHWIWRKQTRLHHLLLCEETCCEETSCSKLWVETKTNKKKHKTPKTPPKKSGVKKKSLFDGETTQTPGIPGDVFQVWRWFRSFLCFYVLPPMIKKLGTHLFLCQPWSHLPHLGDRRPASKNHGCWFPWDSPPHLEDHPIQ